MTTTHMKMAIGTALLGVCSLAAMAQTTEQQPAPGTLPERPANQWRGQRGPERQLDLLTRQLNLAPEQQTGVKAVLEQSRTQVKALFQKSQSEAAVPETPEAHQARIAQMEQIRDESDAKITALLDDNQKKTFAEWVQRRKAAIARHQSQEAAPAPAPNQ